MENPYLPTNIGSQALFEDTEDTLWFSFTDARTALQLDGHTARLLVGIDIHHASADKIFAPGDPETPADVVEVISESALYRLLALSPADEAAAWRKWVLHDFAPGLLVNLRKIVERQAATAMKKAE